MQIFAEYKFAWDAEQISSRYESYYRSVEEKFSNAREICKRLSEIHPVSDRAELFAKAQRILVTMVCVKRSVRLSSKGIDRWRGSFFERGAERSVETLREMRNRSCACGRPASPLPSRLLCSPLLFAISLSLSLPLPSPQDCRFNISSLSLVRPGLLTYPRPDADTVLTSSIPGDDDLQFQTNPPPPPPSPLSLSFSFSHSSSLSLRRSSPRLASRLPVDRCCALVNREFQDFQITPCLA